MSQRFIVILILLTVSNFSLGQKYMFSSTGTMAPSHFYIDTVIKTKLKPNGKIIFNYLDSNYTDSFHLRSFFSTKYDSILRDTFEYFILVNLTKKAIRFNRAYSNSSLVVQELVNHEKHGVIPISFFIYPACGNSYQPQFILKPSEGLIIKNLVKRSKIFASNSPNCSIRLQTINNGILVSKLYRKQVEKTDFFINSSLEKDFHLLKRQIAFLEEDE
jgi:hypothetical protein